MVEEICEKSGKSFENFHRLNSAGVEDRPYIYKGKPLTVDKNCAADDVKYLHWFAGHPGADKSRSIIPHVKELCQHLNVKLYIPSSIDKLQAIEAKIGDVFVVDDLFDLESETQQLLFLQWYNSLPAMCKKVAISNYGPNSFNPFSSVYRVKKFYKPVDLSSLKPALPRRIGIVRSDESRLLAKHDGGWVDITGKEFELDSILMDWLRSDSGAAYPTVFTELPNPMPFTAKEADIWYETSAAKVSFKSVVGGIMKSASFRAARYMTCMNWMSFDLSTIGATVKRMAYQLTKSMDDPKSNVRVGERSWYYYHGEVYAGSELTSPLVGFSWEPLQIMVHGSTYYVTNDDIQEVHRQETSHITKAPFYLILSRERVRKTRAWDKIFESYPPDHLSVAVSFKEKMRNTCKMIWKHVSAHVYVTLLLTVITIIGLVMVQYVKSSREKVEIPKSEFSCSMCWLDHVEPYYNDNCPGSPDYKCTKGKGRRKYSTYVNVNAKKVKVSDLEDSSMECTLHEAHRILGETGFTEDSHRTTMTIKDLKYNIGYRWIDNQVEISIDLPDQNFSASSFDNNICHLRNESSGSKLHGLLLTESVVRFPNHLFHDDSDTVINT